MPTAIPMARNISPIPAVEAMPAARPRVSVVVPVHDRPHAIPAIVATLQAQRLTDWEAIIVDDGSRVAIEPALAPYRADARFRLIVLPHNRGVSAARNAGIDAAQGAFVAFLDSDDRWHPDKLARQVDRIAAATDPAHCFCITRTEIHMPGGWVRVRPDPLPRPDQDFGEFLYADGGFAQISSLMVPTPLARRIRFRESLRQYEDHLFYIELAATGAALVVVPDALTMWTNDDRPDRLSRQDDLDRGERMVAEAGGLLTDRAVLAFRLRVLGRMRFRRRPLPTLALTLRATRTGALSPRAALMLVARWIVPPALWARLRRRLAP